MLSYLWNTKLGHSRPSSVIFLLLWFCCLLHLLPRPLNRVNGLVLQQLLGYAGVLLFDAAGVLSTLLDVRHITAPDPMVL